MISFCFTGDFWLSWFCHNFQFPLSAVGFLFYFRFFVVWNGFAINESFFEIVFFQWTNANSTTWSVHDAEQTAGDYRKYGEGKGGNPLQSVSSISEYRRQWSGFAGREVRVLSHLMSVKSTICAVALGGGNTDIDDCIILKKKFRERLMCQVAWLFSIDFLNFQAREDWIANGSQQTLRRLTAWLHGETGQIGYFTCAQTRIIFSTVISFLIEKFGSFFVQAFSSPLFRWEIYRSSSGFCGMHDQYRAEKYRSFTRGTTFDAPGRGAACDHVQKRQGQNRDGRDAGTGRGAEESV